MTEYGFNLPRCPVRYAQATGASCGLQQSMREPLRIYTCTREPGHSGNHAAHVLGEIVAEWPPVHSRARPSLVDRLLRIVGLQRRSG